MQFKPDRISFGELIGEHGCAPPLSEGLPALFMKPSCERTSFITQLVVAGPNKPIVASVGIEPGGGYETPPVYVISREHKGTEGNP